MIDSQRIWRISPSERTALSNLRTTALKRYPRNCALSTLQCNTDNKILSSVVQRMNGAVHSSRLIIEPGALGKSLLVTTHKAQPKL